MNGWEVLTKILMVDTPAPEIILERDGDVCLDFFNGECDISITASGQVAWAIMGGEHGTDVKEFLRLLEAREKEKNRSCI